MRALVSNIRTGLLAFGLAGALIVPGIGQSFAQEGNQLLATYTLPEVTLADAQMGALSGFPIANDRGFLLGGIGSDLWRAAGDPAGEFWMITDRGPNGQIKVEEKNRRTFPVPDFTPHIVHVKVENDVITILEAIAITGKSGAPVTGLSNIDGIDEKPWDYTAQAELEYNPSGLDSEGLVRAADGSFWVADEYSPSIVHIGADGVVIKRYVPEGVALEGADYDVSAVLPGIFGNRKSNRGFEGLGISADGSTLYVALQSPLSNPDKDTGDASRQTRLLVFDVASELPVAEFVYEFEIAADFDPAEEVIQDDMKLSGVVAINDTTLIVLERTDAVAKLYTVDLTSATDILGSMWDDPLTAPSLEATQDITTTNVNPVAKSILIDLSTIEGMPGKIEGVAIVDATTIAVANDNDFDIGDFDATGMNQGEGKPSQILIIQTSPIPGLDGETMATPVVEMNVSPEADSATPEAAATPVA